MSDIPKWARDIIREPSTLAPLIWSSDCATTSSGRQYPIEHGIPIFDNYSTSYMNQVVTWPEVNRNNPSVRALEDHHHVFDRYAESLRGKVVIDMCAGGGIVSYYLASHYGCKVISIERAFSAISEYGDRFRDYYGVKDDTVVRLCADALSLPISSDSIPVVVGSSWVHHFADKAEILQEARRVLCPQGLLLAHNEGLAGLLNNGTADEDQYVSWRSYRRALTDAGYVDCQVTGWSRGYKFIWWLRGSVDLVARKPATGNRQIERQECLSI